MQEGKKLDALVAEQVMGWKPWRSSRLSGLAKPDLWRTDDRDHPTIRMEDWRPSMEIADAWRVVEFLRSRGWAITVRHMPLGVGYELDGHNFPDKPGHRGMAAVAFSYTGLYWAVADTVPHAICLAALKTPGVPR